MCLAIPGQVMERFDDDMAKVDVNGTQINVSLALVENVDVGDYVIVHTGFALSKLDPVEARETLELFAAMAPYMQTPGVSPS